MESPPSSSSWSHTFILSEDSGLLLSNDLTSSRTSSFESKNDLKYFLYEDTDTEERSLSHDDSVDGMPDIICGQNYSTLKKGPPHWCEFKPVSPPIEPPVEFQDKPSYFAIEIFCSKISEIILESAIFEIREEYLRSRRTMERFTPPSQPFLQTSVLKNRPNKPRPVYFSPDFIPFSPCHSHYLGVRPNSRSSVSVCSRRSSSHSSLYVPTTGKADDSSFITQAVSHDALSVFSPASDKISDLYNVPFDSDMYAVPFDVIRHRQGVAAGKNKRRNTSSSCRELKEHLVAGAKPRWSGTEKVDYNKSVQYQSCYEAGGAKRHSLAGSSTRTAEPIHMTLKEVRQYLQTMYSSSSDTSESNEKVAEVAYNNNNNNNYNKYNLGNTERKLSDARPERNKKMFLINIKNEKIADSSPRDSIISPKKKEDSKKRRLINFRQALLGVFKFKKCLPLYAKTEINNKIGRTKEEGHNVLGNRALPPLPGKPNKPNNEEKQEEQTLDFATSIQKVKDYGWYWGPISSEAAEKILSNEPDGSFIVRDSSDDHYIFSLTFKLNSSVRHVRIEHDQGNFSFGSCTKFKSQTIVDFIENAVEHSRSGRYLFFLHRRPVIGPVRVQLLHPVSRFKQIQSLQHMCRFVIHKNIRRDLIPNLPLPRRMIDYLNTPHYYSEHFVDSQT